MKALLFVLILTTMPSAWAKKNCTNEEKSKWLKEEEFKKIVTNLGYTIEKFKQPGTCYEIYGQNKKGQEVEVYFNPVNAKIIKEEIED